MLSENFRLRAVCRHCSKKRQETPRASHDARHLDRESPRGSPRRARKRSPPRGWAGTLRLAAAPRNTAGGVAHGLRPGQPRRAPGESGKVRKPVGRRGLTPSSTRGVGGRVQRTRRTRPLVPQSSGTRSIAHQDPFGAQWLSAARRRAGQPRTVSGPEQTPGTTAALEVAGRQGSKPSRG